MRLAWLVLLLGVSMGCAPMRVYRSHVDPTLKEATTEQHKSVAFALIPLDGPIALLQRCPQGWGMVSTEVKPLQAVLRAVTLNLYSPTHVQITCSAPKPRAAED